MGRSPRQMERDGGSVEYFDAMVSASAKIYLLLSKKNFCGLISSFKPNLFLCDSNILSFTKLSLLLVASEIKRKCGNNERLRPKQNFSQSYTLLSIIMQKRHLI